MWVPEGLVVGGVPLPERFTELTSVGLAAGQTEAEATWHALREVVERHTLMGAWLLGDPFLQLPQRVVERYGALISKDASSGWETTMMARGDDCGLVTHLALSRHHGLSLFSMGSAAHAGAVGLDHAVDEMLCGRFVISRSSVPRLDRISTFEDRVAYYSDPRRISDLGRLVGQQHITPEGNDAGLKSVAGRLAAEGKIPVKVTLGFGEDARSVVRVLVVGCRPMEAADWAARIPASFASEPMARTAPHPFA